MALSLVTSLLSPAACCLYVFPYIWNAPVSFFIQRGNVTPLSSPQRSSTKCSETSGACYDSRLNYNSSVMSFSVFSFICFCWLHSVVGTKSICVNHTNSHSHAYTYTLLGRYRSMSKQDCDLCMSHQSDSHKGHVGTVCTRQRLTFNWAADELGWPLTSHTHATTFAANYTHTHIQTHIHFSTNDSIHKTLPLFPSSILSTSLPMFCFLVPNSHLPW